MQGESISLKHSIRCLKTEELKSSKVFLTLTNKMVEWRELSGPLWRKLNQCVSRPVSLNLGGNSLLNTLLTCTTGRRFVAIIGRLHTSSYMEKSRLLTI